MAKWNTVKDNKGNTFVSAGGTLWPTIGGGGASLSYGSSVKSNSGGQSSGASSGGGAQASAVAAPVIAAPAVSAPAASGGNAYDNIRSAYESALAEQRRARQRAYDAAVSAQRAEYDANVNKVNSQADKALREAYINKMQTQRTMGQQMAAQGLNGGYSETTAAGLQNNYGNARNALETERGKQLNDLNITLQNNLAAARNILDSGTASDYAQYQTNMANLYANNPVQTMSLEQNGAGIGNSGSTLYQLYQQMVAGGATPTEAMSYLKKSGYDLSQLFAGQ